MPVDASIYSIGAERPKSMLEYQAEFEDRDTRRQSNNLLMQGQRQKLDEYGRAIRSQESIRNRLQSLPADANDDARANALYAEGTPEAIAMAEKLRKAADDSRKTKSSTLKDDVDSENKVVAAYRDMIGMVSDPQAAAQLVTVMHSDPRLKNTPMARVPLEQGLAQIGQDPQAFATWKQQFGLGATKYIEQNKPQYITQNLGGTSQITALPGLGGPGTVASSAPITQSADNKATVAASMANAAAVREAARIQAEAARDSARMKRDQDTEMKLADDHRTQSKAFQESRSAHEQLTATLKSATTSPAATLAAATKFMKILDPGSVVRESELGMALAASGVLDRAANYVSTLQSGKKLTETQAADFAKISDQMYEAAKRVQQDIDKDYQNKAKTYNLRPEMIVQDLGQNQVGGVPSDIDAILKKYPRAAK